MTVMNELNWIENFLLNGLSAYDIVVSVPPEPLFSLYYYHLKSEFRCEKMIMFYLLKWWYNKEERSKETLKSILLL